MSEPTDDMLRRARELVRKITDDCDCDQCLELADAVGRAVAAAYQRGREDAAKIAESPGSAAMLALAAAIRSAP